jgi:hypothetical protein
VPEPAAWAEIKAGKRAKRAQAGALRVTVNMEASIRPRVDAGIDRKKEDAPPSGPLKLRREKRRRATRFSGFSKTQDTLSWPCNCVVTVSAYSPPAPFGVAACPFCTSQPSLLFTRVAVAASGAPAAFNFGKAVFISAELAQSGTPLNW